LEQSWQSGQALLHFSISFFRPSISIPGMNERLTIRNWHFEIFRWLPNGRCDVGHGSGHGRQRGVMNTKGDAGATPTIAAIGSFHRRRAGQKKMLGVPR
jgi:hypothetical protein